MKILFSGDAFIDEKISLSDELIDLIESNDLFVINFEGVITKAIETRIDKASSFRIDISNLVHLQKQINTEIVVSLSNNHMFDFGESGLKECIEILEDNDFKCLINSLIINENENKEEDICLYAFTSDEPSVMSVMESKEHCFYNYYDDIAVNKQQQSIAICHWGDEYVSVPPHRIMTRAQKMSDTFDLVIGHHPHVIQGVKSFENTKVYFSLGNFYLKGFNYKNGALHVFPQECYLGILVSYDTKERISEAYGCRYDEKKKEVLLSNEATNHFVARSEEIKCDSKTAHIRWEKSYYEYLKFRRNVFVNLKSIYPKYKKLLWNSLRKIFAT